jgi:DNA-binding NtrC family response regulator
LDTATLPDDELRMASEGLPSQEALALVIAWSLHEPERVGELALVASGSKEQLRVLGRGAERPGDPHPHVVFIRQRPRVAEPTGALRTRQISRVQLLLRANGVDTLEVRNVGRCALLHDGQPVDSVVLSPGDTLQLGNQMLLLCVKRPMSFGSTTVGYGAGPFGEADRYGIVGESPAIWSMRQQLFFVGRRSGHVLIRGGSGSGKELAARAIHELSERAARPLVARNAATIPESLIDAELFGYLRDYPNKGMPERPGLVGQAHESTLFLDEIGELPRALQAHLLRVLDDGEYQRLGDSVSRTSDFRLVAATNRPDASLKHDLFARFAFRVDLPELSARREDIPLLATHILRKLAFDDSELRGRFFDGDRPRISLSLCKQLVEHAFMSNVRELEALLWQAAMESKGEWLDPVRAPKYRAEAGAVSSGVLEFMAYGRSAEDPEPPAVASGEPTPAEIQEALDRHNGVVEDTWRVLGLSSRHVLRRLIAKYGIEVRRRPGQSDRSKHRPQSH